MRQMDILYVHTQMLHVSRAVSEFPKTQLVAKLIMYNNNLADFWEILWDSPCDTTHSYMWHDSFVYVYRVKILGSLPAAQFTV